MFYHLIIFTLLLRWNSALDSQEETVSKPDSFITRHTEVPSYSNHTQPLTVVSYIPYDDVGFTQIRQQIELLNKNLLLVVEANNERMGRRLSAISNAMKTLIREVNENSRKLPAENSTCTNSVKKYPRNCLKLQGLHQIQIDIFSPDPFLVFCDNVAHGGGWTVILRRVDGSVDFDRNWAEYKKGFGNLTGEFFIGLEKLHALTASSVNELLIVFRWEGGHERFTKYEEFAIGSENKQYALSVLGKFSGDARESLSNLRSSRFFTKDNDSPMHCAKIYGPWWQKEDICGASLNGNYRDGVTYYYLDLPYYVPYVQMMIRPKNQ